MLMNWETFVASNNFEKSNQDSTSKLYFKLIKKFKFSFLFKLRIIAFY